MKQEAPLPPAFRALEGRIRYVRQVSRTEYSASCPQCGGDMHQDGEWPDRFRMFDDGHPTGWCRRCSFTWYPDMADGYAPPTLEQMEKWRQERIQAEEARKRSAEMALEHLRKENIWLRYHQALDDAARRYWQQRGIPADYQDYWKLGWDNAHTFFVRGERYITPSATIPVFDADKQLVNIKHRLIHEPADGGKYRYEIAGQGQPLYLTRPGRPVQGHVVAVEGEIKSMVVRATVGEWDNLCIVGLPGTNPSPDIVAELATAERVTLVMDPGARVAAWDLTGKIGREKCRVLIPPVKIDDGILAGHLTAREVRALLRNAVPAA